MSCKGQDFGNFDSCSYFYGRNKMNEFSKPNWFYFLRKYVMTLVATGWLSGNFAGELGFAKSSWF